MHVKQRNAGGETPVGIETAGAECETYLGQIGSSTKVVTAEERGESRDKGRGTCRCCGALSYKKVALRCARPGLFTLCLFQLAPTQRIFPPACIKLRRPASAAIPRPD